MKQWFADGVFRTILRNCSYLLSGKLGGALFGLVALACTGRGLTPVLFGTLVLIHSYASGVGAVAKFQTWQLLVRYGAPALERGDVGEFRHVASFAFGLDILSGLFGLVGGLALIPFLASWMGIQAADLPLAMFYCTLIPTMAAGTPSGILRVFRCFNRIAGLQLVTPILRAIGGAISYFGHLGFVGFVLTWYVADLAGDLCMWWLAVRELRRQRIRGALRPGLFGPARHLDKAWEFVWTTNVAHSVWAAWGPLSNLIVGGMMGPAGAGLFKVATTFFNSATKPADLLARSFYPEIMRLDPTSGHPWQLALRSAFFSGAAALVLLLLVMLGGAPVIGVVFGKRYIAALDLLQIMTGSLIVTMACFPLESLLYMAHRQRAALVAQTGSAIGYALLLFVLIHAFGLAGAGLAYVGGVVIRALLMLVPTLDAYRRREAIPYVAVQESPA
ncbi:oligosaccharide flippase family protein [Novosphingobium sp. 1949]|uniref:Oligosaccharide flippase family protein n=1 Tax=Novosphingobium organovorum TaxID=2930092 RepID=A0ABT0BC83_9SPHN|nr:oligosaccharide flippase family protein [Novosphingobium organovorum]MCJ2182662.1 oligosaccharide flippase family protein [Novosphingobium organovorum]